MSTGKVTALSAGTCSLGTNSRSGSLPGRAGAGEGDAAAAGGAAGGGADCAAAAGSGRATEPARPPSATRPSDVRTIVFSLIGLALLLRVTRDAEADVRPRLGPVVAV